MSSQPSVSAAGFCSESQPGTQIPHGQPSTALWVVSIINPTGEKKDRDFASNLPQRLILTAMVNVNSRFASLAPALEPAAGAQHSQNASQQRFTAGFSTAFEKLGVQHSVPLHVSPQVAMLRVCLPWGIGYQTSGRRPVKVILNSLSKISLPRDSYPSIESPCLNSYGIPLQFPR